MTIGYNGINGINGINRNKAFQALKAIYDFFAGDISILVGTSVAFVGAFLLLRWGHTPIALVAVLFVAFLLSGLTDSVNREIGRGGAS
jgi:hypothetical protein